MSQIDDQAAKEAAELLPAPRGITWPEITIREWVEKLRPAVAAVLRQRDEVFEETADHICEAYEERISALESQRDKAQADYANEAEISHGLEKRIAALLKSRNEFLAESERLQAENERLRASLDIIASPPDLASFGWWTERARAALAGKGK